MIPAGARMLAERTFGVIQDYHSSKMPEHTLLIDIYTTRNHPNPVTHLLI